MKKMKRIGILSGLALAALALTNCSTKEIEIASEVVAEKEGVPFEIIALPGAETRTVAGENMTTVWDADNDKLNVFHRTAGSGDFTHDGEFSVADAETGTFSGMIAQNVPVAGNSYDWVAIYPYDNQITAFAPSNRYYYVGGFSSKAQLQNGTGSTAHLAGYGYYADGDSDHHRGFPLWGKKENVPYSASGEGYVSPVISMNQVCSILAFNITNSTEAAISISKIEFTATEDIVGAYNIDFSGEAPAFTKYNTYQSATVTLDVTNGNIAAGATGTFYAGIKPFTVEGTSAEPKTLSMKVTTELGDTQEKTFTVTKTMTFSPNKFKNVNMEWTTEHVALDGTYYQITSVSDITADGHYMIVMPDISVTPNVYMVIGSNIKTSQLQDVLDEGFEVDENGLLSYTAPLAKYVWGIHEIVNGGINFRQTSGDKYYGIVNPSSGTDVDTDKQASCYWIPELLSSRCFKLTASHNNRFLVRGSEDKLKAYASTNTLHDQVATGQARKNGSGAWAILKLGAAPVSTPKIEDAAVNDLSPRGSASNTVTVNKKNTESAIKVLSVDNTVVTAASISGNTVTYTISDNLTSSARVGTITLALVDDETVTGTVTVNQLGSEFHLPNDATEATKQVNAAANSQTTINITSDFDWTIDATNLVDATATPASFTYPGSGSNPKTQTVTIKATAANASADEKALGSFKIVRTADNAELTVTVTQKSAKLNPPTGLAVEWSNKASLTAGASWNAVTNASSYAYKVEYDNGTSFIAETPAASNSATFTIAAGTLYKIYVKAVGDNNNWFDSDWSAPYSFNLSDETEYNFTWNLRTNSYSSATTSLVTWSNPNVTMTLSTGSSQQNANSYLGGTGSYTQTRFYTGQVLTLTPSSGVLITKVEFTCTDPGYAAIQQNWNNAEASISGSVVTVIPENGSNAISVTVSAATRVTGVKVYYTGGSPTAQKLTMSTVSCSNSGENENTLTFAWTSVSNATGYKVSTDGGTTWGATITTLSYTWSNLNAGTEYTLYVKAIGDGTNFTDSDPVFAKGTTKTASGSLTIDFENTANTYSDWTFNNIVTKQTNSNVPAHGGSFYGGTDGKASGTITTKNKISAPGTITFYISKETTNTTASSWLIEVSSNGSSWIQVGDVQSASSGITRGVWTVVTRNLTTYSNVYVRVRYDGTTAKRCIDDLTLTSN